MLERKWPAHRLYLREAENIRLKLGLSVDKTAVQLNFSAKCSPKGFYAIALRRMMPGSNIGDPISFAKCTVCSEITRNSNQHQKNGLLKIRLAPPEHHAIFEIC